jgi:hypothetical protein
MPRTISIYFQKTVRPPIYLMDSPKLSYLSVLAKRGKNHPMTHLPTLQQVGKKSLAKLSLR